MTASPAATPPADAPLISVVIPAYNAEQYVKEAAESVLAQTYRPLEIICVDDASTDGTADVLASFGERVRVIRRAENGGGAAARNDGLALARGEYVAFLDADDFWPPEKLAVQEAYLRAHPAVDALFAHMRCFLSPDLPEEEQRRRFCPPAPMPAQVPGTALIRRAVFDKVGAFDPQWRVGEFIDWVARARAAGCVDETLPDVFLMRRIHATNTGITGRASRGDYAAILKAALDRKRRAA